MGKYGLIAAVVGAGALSCGAPDAPGPSDVETVCVPSGSIEGRASPYDSATVTLGAGRAVVCYGRPSARSREIFGGLVPFGQVWRTGANEPTILHVTVPVTVAGVSVEPGSYSIYTRPEPGEWTVHVNRATDRWGIPIDDVVQAADVGSGNVPTEALADPVETFTIRFETTGEEAADLVMEWERTRVRVPVTVRR